MFRCRVGVAERCVDDNDPTLAGGRDIDVVDADPGTGHHLQLFRMFQQLRINLGSRARDDRIVVTDDPVKFSLTQPESHVQLYPWLLLQKLEALLGYFVGDNDFHNPAILPGN